MKISKGFTHENPKLPANHWLHSDSFLSYLESNMIRRDKPNISFVNVKPEKWVLAASTAESFMKEFPTRKYDNWVGYGVGFAIHWTRSGNITVRGQD